MIKGKCEIRPIALTIGIFWGLTLMVVTLISYRTGYAREFLMSIESLYPGFEIGIKGSIIGLLYGFLDGFIATYIFIMIHKFIKKMC